MELQSTSLNPLFSEKDIAFQNNLSDKWQKKVDHYFNFLQITEKAEIEKHQFSGKDKSEFEPSNNLKNIILNLSVAITGRNITARKAERMIEANISVINGNPIKDISENFDSEEDSIPWNNINLDANAWANKPEIRNVYEDDLLQRKKFWESSWEYILTNTYLYKD